MVLKRTRKPQRKKIITTFDLLSRKDNFGFLPPLTAVYAPLPLQMTKI